MAAPTGNKHSSKCTPEVIESIETAIREGKSKSMAFKLAGIHVDTGFDWLRYGRQNPERYPEYVELQEKMELAEAEFMGEMVDEVVATAKSQRPNTWQAAAWLLERKAPEEWGKRDKVSIDASGGPLVQLNQVVLVDADAREASRALLRRVTAGSPVLALGPGVGDESAEESS